MTSGPPRMDANPWRAHWFVESDEFGSYSRRRREVSIPKRDGSLRVLGVPTVSDRIAQTVVKMVLEPGIEPVFHDDFYGYRPAGRRWMRWRYPASVLEVGLGD